jgi:hypothetical protein
MFCNRCETVGWNGGPPRRPGRSSTLRTCEWCGAALTALEGVPGGVRNDTLAQLARFGLAVTGAPLLERRTTDERTGERS